MPPIEGSNAWRELETRTAQNVRAIEKASGVMATAAEVEQIRSMVYDIMKAERKAKR